MSKAIKQILVIAAVVAISMVFIIQFRPGTNVEVGGGGPRCVVEISGECIPHGDYMTAYRLAAPNLDREQLQRMRLRQMVVDGLLERWLLLEDAKRLGITASESDVKEYIASKSLARFSLPAAHEEAFVSNMGYVSRGLIVGAPYGPARIIPVFDPKTTKFDYERYQKWVVRSSAKTEQAFIDFERKEFIAARMRALIRNRVRVSEKEAYEKYARMNEEIAVDYVKLEKSYYQDYVLDKSKDAIDAWALTNEAAINEAWDKGKDKYLPECRQARHILVRIDETATDKEAEKARVEGVLKKAKEAIDGGESFAAVAKRVSEDQTTAKDGGDLGCFAEGKLVRGAAGKKVDEAAFALEVGKISDVVESEHGLHLVVVEKVADEEEAEKIGKKEIRRKLYLDKEAERMVSEGGKQILAAVKDGKSLQEALDAHLDAVLPEEAKKAYEKGKNGGGDEDGGDEDGGDEDGGDEDGGDEDGGDEDGGDEDGGDEEDSGYDAWTDPGRPQVKTSDSFSRGSPPFSRVQNPADASKVLFELEKVGAVPDDVIKLFGGYAVAQLKERKPVEKEKWNEDRRGYIDSLRRQKQSDALVAYVQNLRETYAKEISYKIDMTEGEKESQPEG
jgi:peptidyl-prolyl cis-trans isomerase D